MSPPPRAGLALGDVTSSAKQPTKNSPLEQPIRSLGGKTPPNSSAPTPRRVQAGVKMAAFSKARDWVVANFEIVSWQNHAPMCMGNVQFGFPIP